MEEKTKGVFSYDFAVSKEGMTLSLSLTSMGVEATVSGQFYTPRVGDSGPVDRLLALDDGCNPEWSQS